MKKIILSALLITIATCKNSFSHNINYTNPIKKTKSSPSKSNYNYFSKILVYPLNVKKDLNILNGGIHSFKFYIYDSNQKLILTFDSSPFCSSVINVSSFELGKYIIKADNESESHQFVFIKN